MTVVDNPTAEVLTRFLVQAMIILLIVRLLGRLLAMVHQPRVIGEIIAGIILGPSVLGNIPGFSKKIFPPASLPYLALVAQIGLIFFMFLLGMEVDRKLMKESFKNSIVIALSCIITPLVVGIGMGKWLFREKLDEIPKEHEVGFILFVGTAISFTAFPVLARILSAAGMQSTALGSKMLSVAALDDALGWCTLALALAYINSGSVIEGLYTAIITIGFVLFCAFVMRWVISRVHKRYIRRKDPMNNDFIGVMFVVLCLCAWFCEIFHVHAFFGAFVFGIIMPRKGWEEEEVAGHHPIGIRRHSWVENVIPKLELVVVEFFLPLYFANSGLRTQLNALDTGKAWGIALAVLLIATACKFVPVALVARCFKYSWRESITLGALMNTRGLVALIVLNIGLDKGVLGPRIFSILVVMALITTIASPPMLYFLLLRHQKPTTNTTASPVPLVSDGVLPIDPHTPQPLDYTPATEVEPSIPPSPTYHAEHQAVKLQDTNFTSFTKPGGDPAAQSFHAASSTGGGAHYGDGDDAQHLHLQVTYVDDPAARRDSAIPLAAYAAHHHHTVTV